MNNILCNQFQEHLSDYLDGSLDRETHRSVAAHALRCPMCHAMLNEVKNVINLCREAEIPKPSSALEARILLMTQPETAMKCEDFEELLTEYLDGFLPAAVFHRWERHAVLCEKCTDLPGEVVRSIGVCYTYKADELPVPAGLHERILQATLGTTEAATVKMPVWARVKQAFEDFFGPVLTPVLTPQFASAATMLLLAFFLFTSAASTDGSLKGMYQTSWELAAQTYEQSANLANEINQSNQLIVPIHNQQQNEEQKRNE